MSQFLIETKNLNCYQHKNNFYFYFNYYKMNLINKKHFKNKLSKEKIQMSLAGVGR